MTTRTDTGVLVERAKTTPPSQIILKEPHMLLAQGAVADDEAHTAALFEVWSELEEQRKLP